jgi:phytoene synthase
VTAQTDAWENHLVALAREGMVSHRPSALELTGAENLLAEGYRYCANLTARHSRTFYLASAMLPADKRRAARALYAFCRISDDIVDAPGGDAERDLQAWRQWRAGPSSTPNDLVGLAWADTQVRYRIPPRYPEQLIEGVARDLRQVRYKSFFELAKYAYGVASTVGLMSMHIIGYSGPEAIPYAVKLGVALQLTNILRDVAEDYRLGRVYLPQKELAAYGLSNIDLAAGVVDDRWRAFMQFQIRRNRRLYAEAWPGIALLNPDGRLAIAAAARLYGAILDDIERSDYNVFDRRAYVTGWGKAKMLPGIWWATKRLTA